MVNSDPDHSRLPTEYDKEVSMKIDLHTHILPENWPDLKEVWFYLWYRMLLLYQKYNKTTNKRFNRQYAFTGTSKMSGKKKNVMTKNDQIIPAPNVVNADQRLALTYSDFSWCPESTAARSPLFSVTGRYAFCCQPPQTIMSLDVSDVSQRCLRASFPRHITPSVSLYLI